MPRRRSSVPAYRLRKPSGQGNRPCEAEIDYPHVYGARPVNPAPAP